MKQYGIYGQVKDSSCNGYWMYSVGIPKESAEQTAQRCRDFFDHVAYEVRELPSPNGANQS